MWWSLPMCLTGLTCSSLKIHFAFSIRHWMTWVFWKRLCWTLTCLWSSSKYFSCFVEVGTSTLLSLWPCSCSMKDLFSFIFGEERGVLNRLGAQTMLRFLAVIPVSATFSVTLFRWSMRCFSALKWNYAFKELSNTTKAQILTWTVLCLEFPRHFWSLLRLPFCQSCGWPSL